MACRRRAGQLVACRARFSTELAMDVLEIWDQPLAILIPLLLFLPGLSGAGVAQLVEHLICNQRVGGSIPSASSTRNFAGERGRSESSQEKRTGWCLLTRVLFVFLRGMPASC